MAEISRQIDGIPVVGSATERDSLFPVATRAVDQRVFNKQLKIQQRWDGSAWVTEMSANGLVFNIMDYGAVSGADSTTAIADCIAAANASAVATGAGAKVRIPAGSFINTGEQLLDTNYVTIEWDPGAIIDYRPAAITISGTVSALNGVATFTSAQTGKLREGCRINLPDEAGVGTVTATNGSLTFSTSQAGRIGVGTRILIQGVPCTIATFDGTTGATCTKRPNGGAGLSFTLVHRSYLCSAFNAGMTSCTLRPHSTDVTFAASTFTVAQECFRAQKTNGSYPAKVSFINPRFTSNNDTIPKTAIRIASGSQCRVIGMQIPEGAWDCPNGIGLHISGFELNEIADNLVFAEQPLRISQNIHNPAIGLDSSVFYKNLWGGRGPTQNANLTARECVLVDSDVIMTRITDEDCVTIRGTYGFHYDGLNAVSSANCAYDQFAREQPSAQGDSLYAFYFACNSLAYNISLKNLSLGSAAGAGLANGTHGVYLGFIVGGGIETAFYDNTSGLVGLTLLGCRDFEWRGFWAQAPAVFTATNCVVRRAEYSRIGSYTFPMSGRVDVEIDVATAPGNYPPVVTENDTRVYRRSVSVANNGTVNVPVEQFTGVVAVGTRRTGVLTVTASNDAGAIQAGGIFLSRVGAVLALSATANCAVGNAAGRLGITQAVVAGANVIQINNQLTATCDVYIEFGYGI